MAKIPVGETIAHAYSFAFRDFLKILGITWAPLVVSIALGLMVTPGFFGNHINPNDQDAVVRFSTQMAPISLLILLPIGAMIVTGVTEQALGMRSGWTFVYFSLGAPIWRLIGSWLLFVVAIFVLAFASAIVFGILFALGAIALSSVLHGADSTRVGVIATLAFVLAFYAAVIFITVRLTFFIAPVVVAEKKIDLARVWQLTGGNFWRIVLIGLAITLPLLIVMAVEAFLIYGPNMFHIIDILSAPFHGTKAEVMQQQAQAWSAGMRARELEVWPYHAVFQIVFGTLNVGLTYGAAGFAYRALVPASGAPAMRD